MLKKTLALVLTLCMVLSFVACATKEAPEAPKAETSETTPVEESKPAEEPKEEAKLDYPKETIHIVVTFGAGGGNDLIARAIAAGMEGLVGQSVVVDNVTGAGGMTGSFEVVNGEADGYTILCQDASLTSLFVTQKDEVPFALDDLTPISSVYTCPTWGLALADKGYETLQDFVDAAKAAPGTLTIGTAVTTGAQYLMACAIVDHFDLDVTIIPYEGGGDLKKAVLGGHVDMGIIHSPILLPEVEEGMVNVLVAGDALTGIGEESLRSVKTLKDYGLDTTFSSTRGFFVPNDTPAEIVSYLEDIFAQVIETQTVKDFATTFGYEPSYQNAADYKAFLEQEIVNFQAAFDASQGN